MKKIKVGFIGLGNRGGMYHDFARSNSDLCEVVAFVDFKLAQQVERIGNPTDVKYMFTNTDDFFAANIDLDLLVISSMYKYHYLDAKRGIEHGYHLLLEKPIACSYEEVLEQGISKILWINDADIIQSYIKELAPVSFESVTYVTSQPIFLELFNREVSKGVALDFIAKMYGILQEEVVAFGDGLNDYEMIEYAGMGVAMGNAHPKIKEIANHITATNDEDGIADAIYELILEN